jgi:hypothetical protein
MDPFGAAIPREPVSPHSLSKVLKQEAMIDLNFSSEMGDKDCIQNSG